MKPSLVAVIDDDGAIRRGLSSLLRSEGVQVRLFESAEAFLAETDLRPDAVLTDVQMPGLSGLELLDRLRADQPALPVIIMTAFPTVAIEQRVTAAGAACFISKPFDAEQLLEAISQALEGPGAADGTKV